MKLAKSLSIAAFVCLISSPCGAQSSGDLLNYVHNFAGQYVRGWDDLDARMSDLNSQIEDARAKGKITATQAADFKAQMAQLQAQETQSKGAGKRMGFAQSVQFGQGLSAIAGSLDQAATQTLSSLPDVDVLRARLQKEIEDSVAGGQLNRQAAASLRGELQAQTDIENAYKAETGGNLTPRQIEILSDKLHATKTEIDQQTKVSQSGSPALVERRAGIAARVQADQNAGKINAAQAANFEAQLNRLGAEQQAFETAGGGMLNGTQVFRLAQELDTINDQEMAAAAAAAGASLASIPAAVSTGELDAAIAALTNQLNQITAAGALPPALIAQDTRELDHISWSETAYKAGAGITSPQIQQLLTQMIKLKATVDGQMQVASQSGSPSGPPVGSLPPGGPDSGYPGAGGRHGNWDHGNDAVNAMPPSAQDGGHEHWDHGNDAANAMPPSAPDSGNGYSGNDNWRRSHNGEDGRRDRRRESSGAVQPGQIANAMPDTAPGSARYGNGPAIGDLPVLSQKSFSDVRGYWAQPYIEQLASRGVIGGFPNGTFGPDQPITRAQFAAIAAHALHLDTSASGSNFRDVPDGYWATPSISAASKAGLITGYPDGSFRPEDKITRAQALVILSKALQGAPADPAALNAYSDASSVPGWAKNAIAQAASAHIIVSFPNTTEIGANNTATRGDVAGLMYQTLSALGANLPPVSVGLQ